jgi:hypothetical protein
MSGFFRYTPGDAKPVPGPNSATNRRLAALNIVMDRVWFHPPVPICFPDWLGTTIHVGNVAQATDILLRLWPVEPGQKHRIATEVCLATLEDPAKAGIARQAFHEAAEEAGMLVAKQ